MKTMKYILSSLLIFCISCSNKHSLIKEVEITYKIKHDNSINCESDILFFDILPVKHYNDSLNLSLCWDYVEPYMTEDKNLTASTIPTIRKDLKGKRFNIFNKGGLIYIIVK